MYQRRIGVNSRGRMGFLPIIAELADSPEAQQAASGIISSVTGFFKKLIDNIVIGDQVPDYPIKSKNTYSKIIKQIQGEFPEPRSVAEANQLLKKAMDLSEIMYAKGGDVNVTYGMIYDEVVQTLRNYISYDGHPPGAPTGGSGGPGPNPPPAASDNKMLVMGGLILGGFLLMGMGKPKGRSKRR